MVVPYLLHWFVFQIFLMYVAIFTARRMPSSPSLHVLVAGKLGTPTLLRTNLSTPPSLPFSSWLFRCWRRVTYFLMQDTVCNQNLYLI